MLKFRHKYAIGFKAWNCAYGKLLVGRKKKDSYGITVTLPFLKDSHIDIYSGKTKPVFRNVYVIGGVCFPFTLLLTGLLFVVAIVFHVFASFYYTCLFRKSFCSDNTEEVSGYISLLLSVIGLITVIKWVLL